MTAKFSASSDGTKVNIGTAAEDALQIDSTAKTIKAVGPYAIAGGAPPGMVGEFAMATPPAGWLHADGSLVSRTTYAALFAAIGTVWGAGDGSTTFQLPDFRAVFRRGLGTNSAANTGTPDALGTLQLFQIASHTHTYLNPSAIGAGTAAGNSINAGSNASNNSGAPGGITGGGVGPENRPANYATLVCIKT